MTKDDFKNEYHPIYDDILWFRHCDLVSSAPVKVRLKSVRLFTIDGEPLIVVEDANGERFACVAQELNRFSWLWENDQGELENNDGNGGPLSRS